MRIAICDDEQSERTLLMRYVQQYDTKLLVEEYESAVELLQNEKTTYDIIFMDIEMPSFNGFDAAVDLRKTNHPPLIIFVTKSNSYTIQGYGVAFRYLQKPISYDTFSTVLSLAIKEKQPARISIFCDGAQRILPIKSILYCEALDHNVTVHTRGGNYTTRMTLSELIALLPSSDFASPHKSYLVNLNFVQSIETNRIRLAESEETLPLSKGKRKQFIQQLGDYIGK